MSIKDYKSWAIRLGASPAVNETEEDGHSNEARKEDEEEAYAHVGAPALYWHSVRLQHHHWHPACETECALAVETGGGAAVTRRGDEALPRSHSFGMKRGADEDLSRPSAKKLAVRPSPLAELPTEMRHEIYERMDFNAVLRLALACRLFRDDTRHLIPKLPVHWRPAVYALAGGLNFERASLRKAVIEAMKFGLHLWPGVLGCAGVTYNLWPIPGLVWYWNHHTSNGKYPQNLRIEWQADYNSWRVTWYFSDTSHGTVRSAQTLNSLNQSDVLEWKAFVARERTPYQWYGLRLT